MLTLSFSPLLFAAEPAPVFEAVNESEVSQQLKIVEQRLSRLERQLDSQALVELMSGLDRLQQEIQQLVGQLEEQNHNLENLKKRQRDLYLDMDQRLRNIEEAQAAAAAETAPPAMPATAPGAAAGFANPPSGVNAGMSSAVPAAPASATTPSTAPSAMISPSQAQGGFSPASPASAAAPASASLQVDPQLERKNYEFAFNLLKDGHYDRAVAAFKAFLSTYPNGRYSDNAQYWLGEANYVQRRFNDALQEFDKVVKNHPDSPKRADAMLKMGYTYQELDDFEKARVLLNDVIKSYPGSTAANLAKKRMQDFKQLQ